ncbi:MAG: ATP-binding protein [Candidatus Omnitrophica bacterium]|nr:ATP-binding protein [Candidatus Omnitrophota bacterium]
MLKCIDRFFLKYNTAVARERTKQEEEMFWEAAARSIAPATIEEHKSGKYVIVNGNTYKRCIIVGVPPTDRINGYPKGLSESMMTRLLEMSTHGSQLSISSKLIPIQGSDSVKMMNTANFRNEIKQVDSMNRNKSDSEKVEKLIDENLKIERKHNKDNFKAIVEDNERQFHSALILTMKSDSVEGLNILESDIKSIMGQESVEFEIPDFRHKQTLLAAQPYNKSPDYTQIEVLAPYASMIVPVTNPNSKSDKQGLFFGFDKKTNKQIVVDIDALAALHCIVFGPTQSGKTFTMLMLLWRAMSMLHKRIIYCTPKADKNTDHKAIVDYLGDSAELIETGPGGRNINPMQILYDRSQLKDDPVKYTHAFNNHKGTLNLFFDEWFKDTGSVNMANFIDYSLNKCYENAGIYRNIPSTWHDAKWPVLTDLFAIWEDELKNTTDSDDKKTIKAVLRKTFSLGEGGVLEYLNHQTDKNIDLSKDFIVIDMSGTAADIEDPMRILIAGMMGQRFSTDTKKGTILAIDEARVFLQNPRMSNFLVTALTQGASQSVGLWLFNQDAAVFKKTNVDVEFQTNTFLKVILGNNMDAANIKHVSEYLGLDSTDEENIVNSTVGEGLLVVGKSKYPMIFKPTTLEHDVIKGAYLKNEKKETALESELSILNKRLIKLVMDNGFCLDAWAPGSTLVQEWTRTPVANAFGAGMVTAWIKTADIPSNQTVDHFATVVSIAGQLILNGAENVEVSHFDDADITFKSNGNTHAIEYERAGSHSEPELIEKKFRTQSNYSNVKFVCASGYHKKMVKALGDDFVVKRGQALQDYLDAIQ